MLKTFVIKSRYKLLHELDFMLFLPFFRIDIVLNCNAYKGKKGKIWRNYNENEDQSDLIN